MLEVYIFKVYGKPTGKGRPRMMRSGHVYTPAKTASYEALVQGAFRNENPEATPLTGPVRVTIRACFQVPKSWSKIKQARAVDRWYMPTVKPDADNIAKAVCDALNGLAYIDDTQVVSLQVLKEYVDDGDRVEVAISQLPDWES